MSLLTSRADKRAVRTLRRIRGLYCCGYSEFGQLGQDGENSVWGFGLNESCQISIPRLSTNEAPASARAMSNSNTPNLATIGSSDDILISPNNIFSSPILIEPFSAIKIKAVGCGLYHSIALDSKGQVYTWGAGKYGQLGMGKSIKYQPSPQLVPSLSGIRVRAIFAGDNHTIVLTKSKQLYSCGLNDCGQLGLGRSTRVYVMSIIEFFENIPIRSVSCGKNHNFAISLEDDLVYSWGDGGQYQLGHGEQQNELVPKLIKFFKQNSLRIKSVAAGSFHSLAITFDGLCYSWGTGKGGEIAHGPGVTFAMKPNLITYFFSSSLRGISASNRFSGFVTDLGELYISGSLLDSAGQWTPRKITSNEQVAYSIKSGINHILMYLDNGEMCRNRSLGVIVMTEKNYVRILHLLSTVITPTAELLLGSSTWSEVTGTLDQIFQFHQREIIFPLTAKLDSITPNIYHIAKIWIKAFSNNEFLRIYSIYATNFRRAWDLYLSLIRTSQSLYNFIELTIGGDLFNSVLNFPKTKSPEQLYSIFCAPIQHFSDLLPLFNDLLQLTPETDPEYNRIQQVCSKMSEIDAQLKGSQTGSKSYIEVVKFIQKYPQANSILQAHRKYIKKFAYSFEEQSDFKLHMYIFNDILVLVNDKEVLNQFPFNQLFAIDSNNSITISTPSNTLRLYFETRKKKVKAFQTLQVVLDEWTNLLPQSKISRLNIGLHLLSNNIEMVLPLISRSWNKGNFSRQNPGSSDPFGSQNLFLMSELLRRATQTLAEENFRYERRTLLTPQAGGILALSSIRFTIMIELNDRVPPAKKPHSWRINILKRRSMQNLQSKGSLITKMGQKTGNFSNLNEVVPFKLSMYVSGDFTILEAKTLFYSRAKESPWSHLINFGPLAQYFVKIRGIDYRFQDETLPIISNPVVQTIVGTFFVPPILELAKFENADSAVVSSPSSKFNKNGPLNFANRLKLDSQIEVFHEICMLVGDTTALIGTDSKEIQRFRQFFAFHRTQQLNDFKLFNNSDVLYWPEYRGGESLPQMMPTKLNLTVYTSVLSNSEKYVIQVAPDIPIEVLYANIFEHLYKNEKKNKGKLTKLVKRIIDSDSEAHSTNHSTSSSEADVEYKDITSFALPKSDLEINDQGREKYVNNELLTSSPANYLDLMKLEEEKISSCNKKSSESSTNNVERMNKNILSEKGHRRNTHFRSKSHNQADNNSKEAEELRNSSLSEPVEKALPNDITKLYKSSNREVDEKNKKEKSDSHDDSSRVSITGNYGNNENNYQYQEGNNKKNVIDNNNDNCEHKKSSFSKIFSEKISKGSIPGISSVKSSIKIPVKSKDYSLSPDHSTIEDPDLNQSEKNNQYSTDLGNSGRSVNSENNPKNSQVSEIKKSKDQSSNTKTDTLKFSSPQKIFNGDAQNKSSVKEGNEIETKANKNNVGGKDNTDMEKKNRASVKVKTDSGHNEELNTVEVATKTQINHIQKDYKVLSEDKNKDNPNNLDQDSNKRVSLPKNPDHENFEDRNRTIAKDFLALSHKNERSPLKDSSQPSKYSLPITLSSLKFNNLLYRAHNDTSHTETANFELANVGDNNLDKITKKEADKIRKLKKEDEKRKRKAESRQRKEAKKAVREHEKKIKKETEKYRKELQREKKRQKHLQNGKTVDDYILKISGSHEYFLMNSTKVLCDYDYIRKCLNKQQPIELRFVEKNLENPQVGITTKDLDGYNIDRCLSKIPLVNRPVFRVVTNSNGDNAIIPKDIKDVTRQKEVQKGNFGEQAQPSLSTVQLTPEESELYDIYLNNIDLTEDLDKEKPFWTLGEDYNYLNITILDADHLPTDHPCRYLFITVCMHYGNMSLKNTVFSKFIAYSSNPIFNDCLTFDLHLCEIPREARLTVVLYSRNELSQKTKVLPSDVPIAFINQLVFTYDGLLIRGVYAWPMFPGAALPFAVPGCNYNGTNLAQRNYWYSENTAVGTNNNNPNPSNSPYYASNFSAPAATFLGSSVGSTSSKSNTNSGNNVVLWDSLHQAFSIPSQNNQFSFLRPSQPPTLYVEFGITSSNHSERPTPSRVIKLNTTLVSCQDKLQSGSQENRGNPVNFLNFNEESGDFNTLEISLLELNCNYYSITFPSEKVASLLWKYRKYCQKNMSLVLPQLLLIVDWANRVVVNQIHELLESWKPFSPFFALSLLDYSYPDLAVRKFATRCISQLGNYEFSTILLQLVQVLTFEPYLYSDLAQLLIQRAFWYPRMAYILFWYLKAEVLNPYLQERFTLILEALCRSSGYYMRMKVISQQNMLDVLHSIAIRIKGEKGSLSHRTSKLQEFLRNAEWPEIFFYPLDPRYECSGFIFESCKVLSSKTAPLLLTLKTTEPINDYIQMIYKVGDDLRQDSLTVQAILLIDDMWKKEGLDLRLKPYACLAQGPDHGLIEVVRNATTTSNINIELGGLRAVYNDNTLVKWLKQHNPTEKAMKKAIDNFIHSCAGYSVITFVLGFADRHNDNIMLSVQGHLFHIDFGRILGHYRKVLGKYVDKTDFVFVSQYYELMGEENFDFYVQLCCRAYNILRKNSMFLITLFSLMLHSGLPELKSEADIDFIKDRMQLSMSNEEASEYFKKKIQASMDNSTIKLNHAFHVVYQGMRS